jgi:PleD family two-component response regulator
MSPNNKSTAIGVTNPSIRLGITVPSIETVMLTTALIGSVFFQIVEKIGTTKKINELENKVRNLKLKINKAGVNLTRYQGHAFEKLIRLKEELAVIAQVAQYDKLTELKNKATFEGLFPMLLNKVISERTPLGFVLADLDSFKKVNEE